MQLCKSCTEIDVESLFRVERIADFDIDAPESWSVVPCQVSITDGTANCSLCQFWLEMDKRVHRHQADVINFDLISFPASETYMILAEHSVDKSGGSASTVTAQQNQPLPGKPGSTLKDPEHASDGGDEDSVVLLYVPRHADPKALEELRRRLSQTAWTAYGPIALRTITDAHGITFPGEIIRPSQVNWDMVRRCTQICFLHHACHSLKSPEQAPHLKLIDCHSRQIIHAGSGDSYVYLALSYVWGTGTADIADAARTYPSLPAGLLLPRVIRDAMAAVVQLGFRYLWVDRYCIWQDDVVHKPAQIARMDLIYRNAELTLVAIGGSDPEHGLPGVGETPRTRQPNVAISPSATLVCLMALPQTSTYHSKWNTRAWTYQEAYLSPRRLYFTDEQVYYECQDMMSTESIRSPLQFLTRLGDANSRPPYAWSDISEPSRIAGVIKEYSSRQLSYDGDGLNAISALLREWAARNARCYTIQGLPIVSYTKDRHGKAEGDIHAAFVRALQWVAVSELEPSRPRRRRRDNFPTWTWVSVVGTVSYWGALGAPSERPLYPATVRVETEGGRLLLLDEFLRQPDANKWITGCIHLECYCTSRIGPFKKVVKKNPWSESTTEYKYTSAHKATGVFFSFTFYPDLDISDAIYQNIDTEMYHCFVLNHTTLIVLVGTSGLFQRIGLLRFESDNTAEDKKRLELCDHTEIERRTIRLM